MKVRVEFKDGTERTFNDCNWFDIDRSGGCMATIGKITKMPNLVEQTSGLFTRVIDEHVTEVNPVIEKVAFVDADSVFMLEKIT